MPITPATTTTAATKILGPIELPAPRLEVDIHFRSMFSPHIGNHATNGGSEPTDGYAFPDAILKFRSPASSNIAGGTAGPPGWPGAAPACEGRVSVSRRTHRRMFHDDVPPGAASGAALGTSPAPPTGRRSWRRRPAAFRRHGLLPLAERRRAAFGSRLPGPADRTGLSKGSPPIGSSAPVTSAAAVAPEATFTLGLTRIGP